MIRLKSSKNFYMLLFCILAISCNKGIDRPSKPQPPVSQITRSSLKDLVNHDDFISDSIWKDSTTHTVNVKVGPQFLLHQSFKNKIFPGAIISTHRLLSIENQSNNFETLPVTMNFANKPSITYKPSYENFTSEIKSYLLQNTKPFEQASADIGRPFSTYNDLTLINGYKNEPISNWLKINNKQSNTPKVGIAYIFKIIDYSVSLNLPRRGELIDREKYKLQINMDTIGYVNQINIGKRAVITFMSDTTLETVRIIFRKLKNKESLNEKEMKILRNGEVGYFLQGFGNTKITAIENIEIIKDIYNIITTTSATGEPIEFFVRNIKNFAPHQSNAEIIIRRN